MTVIAQVSLPAIALGYWWFMVLGSIIMVLYLIATRGKKK